ncbi:MAG: glycosyltransferase family 4 protein [Actinomycetota bacterium]|nr:glycosyltransferase family 4 protein [Actinomycetota bacterium]
MTGHIAAFVPNVLRFSPGQRSRIELWASFLEAAGWTIGLHPFEDQDLHQVLYEEGRTADKARHLLTCYRRHITSLVRKVDGADLAFVYREAALVGPALSERLLARRPIPLIYDLDDPTWLPYRSPTSGWMSLLKFPGKTRSLFRLADHVITINATIGGYAGRFNPDVTVIPNCVDTHRYRPQPRASEGGVRLAWIGSHSTMRNLATITNALRQVQAAAPVSLRIVGSGSVPLEGVRAEVVEWSPDTEVQDLAECDIGLVPVDDDPWNHWKFFFKTIQYMALGLPVVARRVGSNSEIVEEGVTGYLVEKEREWIDRLLLLARDEPLRRRMGEAARASVVERFSLDRQMPRLVSVFETVLAGSRSIA